MPQPIAHVALDVPLPKLFDYIADGLTEADIGRRVEVTFGPSKALGVVIELAGASEVPQEKLKPIVSVLRDTPPLPKDWLALARFCAGYYHKPLGEVLFAALPPRLRTLKPVPPPPQRYELARPVAQLLAELNPLALRKRALLQDWGEGPMDDERAAALPKPQRQVFRQLLAAGEIRVAPPAPSLPSTPQLLKTHELTPEQAAIASGISAASGFAVHLLFGITGSGKTEIYLHVIAAALAAGRQALVLVPEIALTPALQAAFVARFSGARIIMQHSDMAEAERARGWLDAQQGSVDIVLGTRLSAFVPLARPGVIVIDEEQDASFKQQEGLRYNARDLCIYRAREAAIPVLLVSATPSLESYHHALAGRYRLHTLSARAHASASLPKVHLVDTRKHLARQGLCEPVLAAMAERLARGEQVLVFLNRRGYAPVLACPACGWISDCPDCAAHLVVHLGEGKLRCHHCGHAEAPPRHCPACGNVDLQPLGRGTQRLEASLAGHFPQARILRVDSDSTRKRGSLQAMLEEVHSGAADILLGTQILAKGHHFEKLTLVVVLNADAGLFAADYRASERLFSQLEQVAGRAGRAHLPGEVWIQTRFPGHALYQALARHDYAGFAQGLLAEREQAGFPPYMFEAALRAEAPEQTRAVAFLEQALALAPQDESVSVFKPVPLALPRLAKLERVQVVMQAASRPRLQAFLREWNAALNALRQPHNLRWHIDVDPTEF